MPDLTDVADIVKIIAALSLLLATVLSFWFAYQRGIGPRTIQLISAALLIPVILILGLEQVFTPEALGIAFGALVGGLLGTKSGPDGSPN